MNIKPSLKSRLAALATVLIALTLLGLWLTGRDPSTQPTGVVVNDTRVTEPGDSGTSSESAALQRIALAESAEFPELMRWLMEGEAPVEKAGLISRLMQRWLAEDLDSFVIFLDEAEVEGLEKWDLVAAGMIEALRMMGDEPVDAKLLGQIVERVLLNIADSDPASALAWARERLAGDRLESIIAGVAPTMAETDPEAAIALLDEVQSFHGQMQAATGVGLALGKSGYPLALTWAESFYSETERAFALSGVLNGMAEIDSERAAAEYARVVETMKSRYREQVLADRAISGTSVDEEYEGLSPEEITKAELAKPNPNLIYLENAARAIAIELSRKDPRSALEWARSMDIYQGKAKAIETIYEEWGSVDAQAAYQSLMKEPDRRPEATAKLFSAWASNDAQAASDSALTMKPGFERDSAIEGVALGWIRSGGETSKIAAWAERLQRTSEVDRVSALIASEAAFDNPTLALKQLAKISNPLIRSELFQEVFPNLVEENPGLARSALATIKLSPVEVEYFQSMLRP